MALFQIYKGNESTLNQVPLHEGYAYFCIDTGKMWIDISSSGEVSENRIAVNARAASGFVIGDTFISADQFVQMDDVSVAGLLFGDGAGSFTGIEIPDKAIVIGKSDGSIEGVEVPENTILTIDDEGEIAGIEMEGAGVLYRLANGIAEWGILPIGAGGTGRGSFATNAVLTGSDGGALNNVETANGAFYAEGAGMAPKFGTLPIGQGGTNATTAQQARENLDVYAKGSVYTKEETNTEVKKATTVAYNVTLVASGWSKTTDDAPYTYTYTNEALRCGNGDVPPIITYTSNLEDYCKIDKATATAGAGIVFEAEQKPEDDIDLIIVDNA